MWADGDTREEWPGVVLCPLGPDCRTCPPADPAEAAAFWFDLRGDEPLGDVPW